MTQTELLPLPRIVERIQQLCAQRLSGTVFLVSEENRMAQLHLDNGDIASLLCRNLRGLEALGIIATMQRARLNFDATYISKGTRGDLSTQSIFDILAGAGAQAPAPAAAAQQAAQPAAPAAANRPPARPAKAQAQLTPQVKTALQRILTQYIGPMAEIVFADHAGEAGNAHALVQLLASEIGTPAQAARFRADVVRELGLE